MVNILIAEDDPVSCYMLETTLLKWGYQVTVTGDGALAYQALQEKDAPHLVILDWMMPNLDGLELCRKLRQDPTKQSTYIIMLTAKSEKKDIITGLEEGADDYITKPFDREELRVRVRVGARIVELQQTLADRVNELEAALTNVKQLQGILPICSHCKKVRDDQNYWQQVESYISKHTDAQFSHSICPDCFEQITKAQIEELKHRLRKDTKF
ncbi:MAG: response regulator [Acidobacteria bacterium]|nr:response regulator [Acidobacteriota bacterium]